MRPTAGASEAAPAHWLRRCVGALVAGRRPAGLLAPSSAGIHGWFGDLWSWFGMQGFEYLDLGRFWQILLTIGLAFWVVILYRGLRSRLRVEHRTNMPWLFFYAALALPAFYAVGLLAHPRASFAVPTSGASSSSTSGWRTSWSCSPR